MSAPISPPADAALRPPAGPSRGEEARAADARAGAAPSRARRAGRIAGGIVLGVLLLPALLGLLAIAGDVTAFRYQGY